MATVASGEYTITDLNDGLNALLSQASILIATDADGNGGDFSAATTTISVRLGLTDDSANWTFAATPGLGVTGALIGQTYTVTALSVDSSYVDLTAARPGFANLTVRLGINKARRGLNGPSLVLSASAAGFTFTDGVASPATQAIAITALHQATGFPVLFYASNGVALPTDKDSLSPMGAALGLPLIGSGDTCYVDLSVLGAADQIYVTAVCGEATAVAQLSRINTTTAAAGATRNVYRGAWTSGTVYAVGDHVTYDGTTGYVALVQHVAATGVNEPTAPNTWWALAAVQGVRGTIQAAVATAGTVWSSSEANDAIVAAGGIAPLRGDVVTLYNSSVGFSQTRVRTTSGTWGPLAAFFGGDVFVDGTLVGSKLAATDIITQTAQIGDALVTNAKIGGVIQSDDFVAGVSGWQIDKAGAAEFNSLAVRADMIVAGAISAQMFYNFSSAFTVSSGDVAATPKQIGDPFSFSAAPYFGTSRVPDPFGWGPIAKNPCVLTIMGEIRNNDTSVATTAVLKLQGRNGFSGAWSNLSETLKVLPVSSGNFFALSARYIDVSAQGGFGTFLQSHTTPYDEYRLVAYRFGGGGTGFTIEAGASIILEQISK